MHPKYEYHSIEKINILSKMLRKGTENSQYVPKLVLYGTC